MIARLSLYRVLASNSRQTSDRSKSFCFCFNNNQLIQALESHSFPPLLSDFDNNSTLVTKKRLQSVVREVFPQLWAIERQNNAIKANKYRIVWRYEKSVNDFERKHRFLPQNKRLLNSRLPELHNRVSLDITSPQMCFGFTLFGLKIDAFSGNFQNWVESELPFGSCLQLLRPVRPPLSAPSPHLH